MFDPFDDHRLREEERRLAGRRPADPLVEAERVRQALLGMAKRDRRLLCDYLLADLAALIVTPTRQPAALAGITIDPRWAEALHAVANDLADPP